MTTTRSLKTSGVALAGVAAMAVAAPAVVPGQIAGLPSALSISKAEYRLTAIADIDFQQIAVAAATGFGGLLGPTDPFYPGEFDNDVLVNGPAGVAYYLIDTAGFVPLYLDRYFFEAGSLGGNPITSGLAAVAYVGAGSVFGVDSPITQAVKSIASGGGIGAGFDLSTAIAALTAGIPVVGDLASVYFTGTIPGDSTIYGTGVTGLITYATNKLLPGGLGTVFQNLDLTALITTVTGLISGITGGNGIKPWQPGGSDDAEDSDDDSEGSDDADESDSEDSESDESESDESESEDSQPAAAVAARVRGMVSGKAAAAAPAASRSVSGLDGTAGKDAPEAAEAPESEAPETEAPETEASKSEASESEDADAPKADKASVADAASTAKTAPVTAKAAGAARTKSPAPAGAAAGPARRIASALRNLAPKSAQSGHVAKRGKVNRAG